MTGEPIRVLFLCTHNSARSQMAEALLRWLGNGRFEVFSAGTKPSRVHPLAIEAMGEVDIELHDARSKHLDEFIGQSFDYVITVCDRANESCPIFPGDPDRIHWSFPDPSVVVGSDQQRLEAFTRVRNDLTQRLRLWLPIARHQRPAA